MMKFARPNRICHGVCAPNHSGGTKKDIYERKTRKHVEKPTTRNEPDATQRRLSSRPLKPKPAPDAHR
jgi:hypothetical protein